MYKRQGVIVIGDINQFSEMNFVPASKHNVSLPAEIAAPEQVLLFPLEKDNLPAGELELPSILLG